MWILTVLLGLTVAIVGVLVSLGFMSGRELYEQKVIYKMETDASSTSIKVLDIDPSPLTNMKSFIKWKMIHRPLRLRC